MRNMPKPNPASFSANGMPMMPAPTIEFTKLKIALAALLVPSGGGGRFSNPITCTGPSLVWMISSDVSPNATRGTLSSSRAPSLWGEDRPVSSSSIIMDVMSPVKADMVGMAGSASLNSDWLVSFYACLPPETYNNLGQVSTINVVLIYNINARDESHANPFRIQNTNP
eukprot:m.202581 g.202581  ORF g.202581 m.202581 type:complete len:169 (-) comp14977_c1_seq14:2829-3335(-)